MTIKVKTLTGAWRSAHTDAFASPSVHTQTLTRCTPVQRVIALCEGAAQRPDICNAGYEVYVYLSAAHQSPMSPTTYTKRVHVHSGREIEVYIKPSDPVQRVQCNHIPL
jgi:hypothetical protein